jgi:hypothetical protein
MDHKTKPIHQVEKKDYTNLHYKRNINNWEKSNKQTHIKQKCMLNTKAKDFAILFQCKLNNLYIYFYMKVY